MQAAPVVPLSEGQQDSAPAPKRDHAKKHAKAAATAKAKTLGVSRAAVERADAIKRDHPEPVARLIRGVRSLLIRLVPP